MRITNYVLLISLLPSLFSILHSQKYLFDVEIINIEDGLSHRRVFDIVQDNEGFIWVSMPGAISRYDGNRFKTYDVSFLNIHDDVPSFLGIDKNNHLWYCEWRSIDKPIQGGVINTQQDTICSFETFTKGLFTSGEVIHINNARLNNNDLFIATRRGIVYRFDGTFEEIYRFPNGISNHVICEPSPDGGYWILHGKEAIQILNQQKLQSFQFTHTLTNFISFYPSLILETRHADTVRYWQLKQDRFVPYIPENYASDDIKSIFQIQKDYRSFATNDAVLVQDTLGNILFSFDEFEKMGAKSKFKHNTTLLDGQNLLWITTENGLFKLTQKKNPFSLLQSGNSTRGIYQTADHLWIGGYFGNVRTDLNTGRQMEFISPPIAAMAFHKDHQGHIWIGTSVRFLYEYVPDQDSLISYEQQDLNALYLPFQNQVTGQLWIGTNNGLMRFDNNNNKTTPFRLSIPSEGVGVRQIHQNEKGVWLVTNKGLFLMNSRMESLLEHYTVSNGLPHDNLNHLYEDKAGLFWLGTKGGGLIRWDIEKNTFRQFSQENGLSNNNIYAVYEDEFETLWLPSDFGLTSFDKNAHLTRVYLPQNGIAHKEFNRFSHFQAEDGTLYFGGLNGVTKFHPKDLKQNEGYKTPIYITRLQLLEQDAEEFIDKTEDYLATKSIQLSPNVEILELEISILDYERSEVNQYAYQIEGYQNQWIYTKENKISIINLPYGNYQLRLKGRGASGTWSSQILSIPIIVRTPFYLQWWFIVAVAVLIAGSIMVGMRWRVVKLHKDRERLEREVKNRTRQIEFDRQTIAKQAEDLQQLDKAKTRFFSNITHEFRTPLTLITGPTEQLLSENQSGATRKRLSGIAKNARSLLELINQLLDLSKLEGGQMKIEVARGDIVKYTRELVNRFKPLADKKEQQLIFKSDQNAWETHFDKRKWDKVIYNLLSNAVKFTPNDGTVELFLRKTQTPENEEIRLIVKDTGIGIEEKTIEQIFDRFYQVDPSSTRVQGGTGIGLALVKELVELQDGKISVTSKPGQGTMFEVNLPVLESKGVLSSSEQSSISSFPVFSFQDNTPPADQLQTPVFEETGKLELLIIEDNYEMWDYIRLCIDTSKYNISDASNGEEGIEIALRSIPDLIISDVMMPKKNGFEVVQTIRDDIRTSHIPIVLLTARASLESRLKGIERGADAYLTKPFSPKELALRIQKLIEIRESTFRGVNIGDIFELREGNLVGRKMTLSLQSLLACGP